MPRGYTLTTSLTDVSFSYSALPLDNAIAVLQFVHKVFFGASDAAKRVANALWPEVQAYVQDKYILDTLPSVYADLKAYDAPSRVLELEQLAASLGPLCVCQNAALTPVQGSRQRRLAH